MKPIILLISFSICLFDVIDLLAQPQDVIEVEELTEMSNKIDINNNRLIDISSPLQVAKKTIKGIYLDTEWKASSVYTVNKEFLSCSARYNIYKNRIEIRIGEDVRSLHPHNIKGIAIDGDLFIYLSNGEDELSSVKNYYQVLSEGNLTLLKKYRLELHNSGGTSLHPNLGTQKEYKSSEDLYYARGGEGAFKLKRGKKNLEQLFGPKFQQLKIYADENSVGFKKEKDLIQLFDHYNSI